MSQNRSISLDICKGIAMIAVVFSHEFASVSSLVLFCDSFMLPLFFMVSGYCISPFKYSLKEYVQRKTKALLIPYLALGGIVSLLYIPINGIAAVWSNISVSLFSWSALWFIFVLFVADIIFYTLLHAVNYKNTWIFVCIISMLGGIVLCKQEIRLPFNISTVPIAIFYLSIGYGYKRTLGCLESSKIKMWIAVVSGIVGFSFLIFVKSPLVLISNEILPWCKILSSVLECVFIMLIISVLSTPPYAHITMHAYKRIQPHG